MERALIVEGCRAHRDRMEDGMPDQEVLDMTTQEVRPHPRALERGHRDQRGVGAGRKATVVVLMGLLLLLLGAVACESSAARDDTAAAVASPAAGSEIPSLPGGAVDPGRYVFTSFGGGSMLAPDHDRRCGGL
jgi:hypothetical protein